MLPQFLQYDFMIRAIVAGVVVAVIAPCLGTFLVVRRYSLMADTLAHVALAGVAIGLLLHIHPLIAATVTGLLAAVGIERLRGNRRMFGESVLSLFLSGSLAIAVVLLSARGGLTTNVLSFLFGSITTVTSQDVTAISILGSIVVLLVVLFYRQLFTVAFDEEIAQTSGLRVQFLNMLIVLLAAMSVTLAMRVVGALLIGALMVIPVMTALQLRQGFLRTMLIAIVFALIAVLVGLVCAYYFDVASGGMIVVIALISFGGILLIRRAP